MIHIVDDDTMLGEVIAEMISSFSDKARIFSSPVEYLKYVSSPDFQKPLATFTDINMPDMSGYELIEKVLAIYPDQKFVVITGRPDFEHPSKNKACLYLSKPFHAHDIQKVILTLRKCESYGPSSEIGCASTCDCLAFGLDNWSCPHPVKV